MSERWEEVARELGTWDFVEGAHGGYAMVKQDHGRYAGDYVETEPSCQRIAALERELASRHKRVDELIGDVSRAEGENAGLREALTERDRRIADLEHDSRSLTDLEQQVVESFPYAADADEDCAEVASPAECIDYAAGEMGSMRKRIANLESLLPQAFDAGTARGIASHRDFEQVHPDRDAWVREALGKDEEEQ